MSDETPNTPATPDAGAGAPVTPQTTPAATSGNGSPDGGGNQPGQPFAVFPTAEAFNTRLQRETRKTLDNHAKQAGFDSWDAMLESRNQPAQTTPAVSAETPTPEPTTPPGQPTAPAPIDEAKRLRMALQVATEKGLPPALIARLQGDTPEEMAADADSLIALVQRPPSGPGIPPAPRNGQTVTFTRAQMRDPAFVRQHADEIQRAAREGRIVDS